MSIAELFTDAAEPAQFGCGVGGENARGAVAAAGDPPRPKWLGSLIYRCGKCDDGTTMTVRRNKSGTPVYRCRKNGHCCWPAERTDKYVENVIVARLSREDVARADPARGRGGCGRAAR